MDYPTRNFTWILNNYRLGIELVTLVLIPIVRIEHLLLGQKL